MKQVTIDWRNGNWHCRCWQPIQLIIDMIYGLVGRQPKTGTSVTIWAKECGPDDEDAIRIEYYILSGFYFESPHTKGTYYKIPFAVADSLGFIDSRQVQQYYQLWVGADW